MDTPLQTIQRQLSVIRYQHREGGKYAYVQFLSITRDLPALLGEEEVESRRMIEALHEQFNESLCNSFSGLQEKYFEAARVKVLQIIDGLYSLRAGDKAIPVDQGRF